MSEAKYRIYTAIIVGIVMVSGALYYNLTHEPPQADTGTSALQSERKHIAVVDSDNDGVPDWQDDLIDTEPIFLNATNTEPYVMPDTVTGQLVYQFTNDVTALDSLGLLSANKETLVRETILDLEKKTAAHKYAETDLTNIITTSDPEALQAYGNLVALTIVTNKTSEENELEIFSRMTADNNPKHLEKLKVIEDQYTAIIDTLLTMDVPQQYIFEHLAIVNSFSELKQDVYGMQLFFDDPTYTSMRYRRFYGNVLGMASVLHDLYDALYLDEKIPFADDDPLRILVDGLPNV